MHQHDFTNFSFRTELFDIIRQLTFERPTEIQSKVIPPILNGKDVIGQSQTGSGKTHAYLLPMFNMINEHKQEVQFVITAPTRELAMQIFAKVKEIIQLAKKKQIWTAKLVVGGTDKKRMKEKLQVPPQIIVGTPGRILDLVKENAISIYSATTFVIDEADLMFDLGFIHDVDQLLIRCKEEIQLLVFSATIPEKLQHFLKKYLQQPHYIKLKKQLAPEKMEHRLIAKRHQNEADIIMDITKIIHPYLAIIFTNSKEQADELAQTLIQKGLEVGLLHGGLSPRVRKRLLKEIENLRYQYIVATDLIARGIDIKGVSHVINAQLPKEEEFYIHRVGRTARADMEGTAISIYDDLDIQLIEKLEQKGIQFIYSEIKDGEWQEGRRWNQRNVRRKRSTNLEREAWKRIRKPKKVKPGYKKKMKKQQEQVKKQLHQKKRKRRNHKEV